MRYADPGLSQALDLGRVGVDAVGYPRAVGKPSDVLEQLDGTAAVDLLAVTFLVGALSQVGVEPDVEPGGQLRRLRHQAAAHGEGRARGQGDADHGSHRPVVVGRHRRFACGQDRVLVLAHRVGGQAAVLLGHAHRAPGGMEAHPDLARRGDLGPQQVAGPRGVDVKVVGGRGATTQCQLGQADEGRKIDRLLVDAGPVGVERTQPIEQTGAHRGRERPGEVLVDVVMGVDEPRRHHTVVRPNGADGRRLGPCRPDTDHEAVVDGHPAARHLPGPVRGGPVRGGPVHRHHHLGSGDDEIYGLGVRHLMTVPTAHYRVCPNC